MLRNNTTTNYDLKKIIQQKLAIIITKVTRQLSFRKEDRAMRPI